MEKTHFDLTVYESLAQGEYQLPSIYFAALKTEIMPTEELLRQKLEKLLDREDIKEIEQVKFDKENDAFKIFLLDTENNEFIFGVRFYPHHEAAEMWHYDAPEYCNRNLLEDERIEMALSPQTLECWCFFDLEYPQEHLMLQLAIIDALAGECYALREMTSTLYFSGTWLAEMAQTQTPISPEMTYVIHAISPEDPEKTPGDWWLHTHGLLKFGLPELEIVKAHTDNVHTYQHLINATALQLFDEPKRWQEKEEKLVAYTEQGYVNIWLEPWQKAVTSDLLVEKKGFLLKKAQPFSGNLNDRDDVHSKPAMVIFAHIDEKIQPLSAYGEMLHNDNHIMKLLPNSETYRMSVLAQEKFHLLAECVKKYPPQEGWSYLIKFACSSEQTEETEHMWFVVKEIKGEIIHAELINEPFNIPEMQCGEVYKMPLDRMTDWQIYSTPMQAMIDPDNAFKLRRYLRRN